MNTNLTSDRTEASEPERATLPVRLSPTALDTFSRCPQRFLFQYVTRPEVERPTGPALVLGQAVHTSLAALYRLPLDRRTVENAHRLLRGAWSRTDRDEAFLSRDDEADWGRRALAMLDGYCAGWDLSVRPLAVESWVSCRLANGIELFGKADRVDHARAGPGLEVVDYKTGRLREEDEDLSTDVAAGLYALAASRTYGRLVSRVRFIYLAEAREVSWNPEPEDLAAAEKRLLARTEQIHSEQAWEGRPGHGCGWCPYSGLCPWRDNGSVDDDERPELPF